MVKKGADGVLVPSHWHDEKKAISSEQQKDGEAEASGKDTDLIRTSKRAFKAKIYLPATGSGNSGRLPCRYVGLVSSLRVVNGLTINQPAWIPRKPERNGELETLPSPRGSLYEPSKHMIPACRGSRSPLT